MWLLVEKVIVSPQHIEVRLRANGIEELTLELRPAVPERRWRRISKTGEPQVTPISDGRLTISVLGDGLLNLG